MSNLLKVAITHYGPPASDDLPIREYADWGDSVIDRAPDHSILVRIPDDSGGPKWMKVLYKDIVGWVWMNDINFLYELDLMPGGEIVERQVYSNAQET